VFLLYQLISGLLQSFDLLFVSCERFLEIELIFKKCLYRVQAITGFLCLQERLLCCYPSVSLIRVSQKQLEENTAEFETMNSHVGSQIDTRK